MKKTQKQKDIEFMHKGLSRLTAHLKMIKVSYDEVRKFLGDNDIECINILLSKLNDIIELSSTINSNIIDDNIRVPASCSDFGPCDGGSSIE